jgi:catechol 2,3-dioxygenase-like lactoylglutathione lyase family enzyme
MGGNAMNDPKVAPKAHIALHVRDLARSVEFYRKLFAAEPVKLRPGYAKFDISRPPLNFTLNESRSTAPPAPGSLSHLGIQVASTGQVLEIRDRWSRAGLDTRDEMQTECCFALQDKAWARDPDRNEWEAFAVLEDNLPEKAPTSVSCCAPECCAPAK